MNVNIRVIAHVVETNNVRKVETWAFHLAHEMVGQWIVGPAIIRGKLTGAVCSALGADTTSIDNFTMERIDGDIFCAVCAKKQAR